MANNDQLRLLKRSSASDWNNWKAEHFNEQVDLSGEVICDNLTGFDLRRANFRGCDLSHAMLDQANLFGADFSHANLQRTMLNSAYLYQARFADANLRAASLRNCDLTEASFTRADMKGADLRFTKMVRTSFSEATLEGCRVFGASVWEVGLGGSNQSNLVISELDCHPTITSDNLEVAQFIHLLLNSHRIRQIIDTITSKVVLILGRFTPERKAVLDAIRDELRQRNYLPVLFDFEKPANRDSTETVSTLAHMARFVIADITDAKSIPQELMRIVPALPSVPVQPLLLASQREYGMFEHFKRFPWVLEPFLYDDQDHLLGSLTDSVIGPAEAKTKRADGAMTELAVR